MLVKAKYKCLDCNHEFEGSNKDGLNCPMCKGPIAPLGETGLLINSMPKTLVIHMNDKIIIAFDEVIVTYKNDIAFTYNPEKVSELYLNEEYIIDIQVLRNNTDG